MKTYPIMLNLAGRRAVVVGAGAVGRRKAAELVDAGAEVRLIDPEQAEADEDERLGPVERIGQAYRPELLTGALLVLACTDDRTLNARIAADARARGILVNAADEPDSCDFLMPAVLREGDVVVAVGTGGTAPALARQLRDRLARALPRRVGAFAALLGELRREVKHRVRDAGRRARVLRKLAEERTYERFRREGPEAVQTLLRKLLGEP